MAWLLAGFIGANAAGPSVPASSAADPLGLTHWRRTDLHDGYVIGNGSMYVIAGVGREMDRTRKSRAIGQPSPLSAIAWVIGPTYALGNLGWGWQVEVTDNGVPVKWTSESIVNPTAEQRFWGVACATSALRMRITDVLLAHEPVLMRRVSISRMPNAPAGRIRLHIPVQADARNGGKLIMAHGELSDTQPPPVPPGRLRQSFPAQTAWVLVGAQRPLWGEISTVVPNEDDYRRIFPPRALATTVTSAARQVHPTLDPDGFSVDVGDLAPGATRELTVWLVTVSAPDATLEAAALRELGRWRNRDPADVAAEMTSSRPPPLLQRTDGRDDPMLRSIEACSDLITACQARSGGVMAQPHMYPMYYVRDQYGSLRLFLARGEYERAWGILGFHLGMAALFGLQNAYDSFAGPPDPTRWPPRPGATQSKYRVAEGPSYMVLEARDYYRATGDLARVAPLYRQLAFDLRVQQPSSHGLFPSPGDESYTNSKATVPHYTAEMTDSSILFVAAARFMSELAGRLGHSADQKEFGSLAQRTEDAMMSRLWLRDRRYWAYARADDDNPASVDTRPALDSLLRRDWLEEGDPDDPVSRGCLAAVLKYLVDPVRIVPETYDFTAGMDPGYLLHALSRAEDGRMHDAAALVLKYASAQGMYSEYYRNENGIITPFSANLRPWESAVNATALIDYVIGLSPDLPNGRISLLPHLPADWPGWVTRPITLPGQGTVVIRLERAGPHTLRLDLQREGEGSSLDFDVGLGGFATPVRKSTSPLQPLSGHPSVARGVVHLQAGASWSGTVDY